MGINETTYTNRTVIVRHHRQTDPHPLILTSMSPYFALTRRNLCTHHSQGRRAAFAKFCHDTSRHMIKTMNHYEKTYPLQLVYDLTRGQNLSIGRSLSQDVLELHSSIAKIHECLESGKVDLSSAVFSDEIVECEGTSLSNVLMCVACRLSAVLPDFISIQTTLRLANAMNDKRLLRIVRAMFAQIACVHPKYTVTSAHGYEAPLFHLEKIYMGSFNFNNSDFVAPSQLADTSTAGL